MLQLYLYSSCLIFFKVVRSLCSMQTANLFRLLELSVPAPKCGLLPNVTNPINFTWESPEISCPAAAEAENGEENDEISQPADNPNVHRWQSLVLLGYLKRQPDSATVFWMFLGRWALQESAGWCSTQETESFGTGNNWQSVYKK